MGYGDFQALFAALGRLAGLEAAPRGDLALCATGALLGILMIVLRGRDRSAPMPSGPTSLRRAGSP